MHVKAIKEPENILSEKRLRGLGLVFVHLAVSILFLLEDRHC